LARLLQASSAIGVRALGLLYELRHAVRGVGRNPGHTMTVVLTLAVGMATSGILFGFVEGIWTRPLPGVRQPGDLVRVYGQTLGARRNPQSRAPLSYPEFLELRRRVRAFAAVAATERRGPLLRGRDFVDRTSSEVVSDDYFTTLDVDAEKGRLFREGGAGSAEEPVLVLSDRYWRRRFGSDPAIVGRSVQLNETMFTVMGVAASGFRGSELWTDIDLWIARSSWEATSPGETSLRQNRSHAVVGRLREGADLRQAQAQADVVARSLAAAFPDSNRDRGFVVLGDRERRWAASGHAPLMIMGLAGLVLLIACANAAGLLLARHQQRRRETATRLALGCGRARLVGQLLAEGAVLAVLASAAGVAVSVVGLRVLVWSLVSPGSRFHNDFTVDARVVAFVFGLACLAILLAALVPALRAARENVVGAMKGETASWARPQRARGLLVGAQIAVSVVLVAMAGLLARSFFNVTRADLGFERRDVLLMQLSPPYDRERSMLFYDDLLGRLGSLPGVRRACVALRAPLSGSGGGRDTEVAVPGRTVPIDEPALRVKLGVVGTGYFDLLGIRLRGGRAFESLDAATSDPVAIVNETMARRLWPDENPVGRFIRVGPPDERRSHRIIAVAQDTRVNQVTERPEPYLYLPASQRKQTSMTLMLETDGRPLAHAEAVTREIAAVDPQVVVTDTTSLGNLVREATQPQRSQVVVVSALGVVGLLLAATGLFALMANVVVQRRREVAIRMAVGASVGEVTTLMIRQAIVLAGIGVALGVGGALVATPVLSAILHGVTPYDWPTYVLVVLVVLAVAAAASTLPVRRAARVDPAQVLRWE
jgi:putative ABC transport system permease protein